MKYLIKLVFVLSAVILFYACEADPISIGEGILPDSDKLHLAELNSEEGNWPQYSYSFQYDTLNTGSSKRFLIGSFYQNSYSITSSSLVEWFIVVPDSVVEAIGNGKVQVTQAWIEMIPAYQKSDVQSTNFSVHRINSSWSPSFFNEDSLALLDIDAEDSFIGFIDKSDSLLSFQISPKLAQGWFDAKADSTLPINNGIYIEPIGNVPVTGYFSANALITDFNPKLNIEFINSNNVTYIDTISSQIIISDVHVNKLQGQIPINTNSNIVLHTGKSVRASLFFDLADVPKNAIINKAELTLRVDTVNSVFGSPRSDTLFVVAYSDSTDQILSTAIVPSFATNSDGVFTSNITSMMQSWVTGNENLGVVISLTDEERSISRVELFGSKNQDPSLRPKIKVIFTIPGK